MLAALFAPCDPNIDALFLVCRQCVFTSTELEKTAHSLRKALLGIVNTMRMRCTDTRVKAVTKRVQQLRELVTTNDSQRFDEASPQDSGELLLTLCGLLGVDSNVNSSRLVVQGTNNLLSDDNMVTTTDRLESVGVCVVVPMSTAVSASSTANMLISRDSAVLENPYLSKYIRRVTTRTYVPITSFCLIIDRREGGASFDNRPIPINDEIIMAGDRTFRLASIVLYRAGHYTCCYRDSNINSWVLYNDAAKPSCVTIDTTLARTIQQTNAQTNATVLIYSRR